MAASVGLGGCGASAPAESVGTPEAQELDDGSHDATCLALGLEYVAAQPEADQCVPGDICDALRPSSVYLVEGEKKTFDGLTTCASIYNRARVAKLDEILRRMAAAGCEVGSSPCHPPIVFSDSNPPPACKVGADGVGRCDY